MEVVMHYGNWNDGWDSWWWMAVMMIVFWGGLIWIAVMLTRRGNHTTNPQTPTMVPPPAPIRQAPDEILAERFARGEIESDDYHQRLDALRRGQAVAKEQG